MSDKTFNTRLYELNLASIVCKINTELYLYLFTLTNVEHIKATIANQLQYVGYSKDLDWLYSTLNDGQNIHTRIS